MNGICCDDTYEAMFKPITMRFVGTQPSGHLSFGYDVASMTGREVLQLTNGPVLVIADNTVVKLGIAQAIFDSLEEYNVEYDVFTDIQPEPYIKDAARAVAAAKMKDYGAVIGIGGGSALDTAKLAAAMARSDADLKSVFDDPSLITSCLPKILIPTTSGTGSEVSPYIVLCDDDGKKAFIGPPQLYATVALVDPRLTITMPASVTASTGLDALTHGVEGACGAQNPYTEALAAKCVELVLKYLPRAVKDGNDLEARYYMAFASVLGMMSYTQGGGLYAHSLSYILTKRCGLSHGAGCAIALANTLRFNAPKISKLISYLELASECGNLADSIYELIKNVGLPTKLSDIGISESELPHMAQELVTTYFRSKNPVEMRADQALEILKDIF